MIKAKVNKRRFNLAVCIKAPIMFQIQEDVIIHDDRTRKMTIEIKSPVLQKLK